MVNNAFKRLKKQHEEEQIKTRIREQKEKMRNMKTQIMYKQAKVTNKPVFYEETQQEKKPLNLVTHRQSKIVGYV